jgi:hypothetical protein
MADPGNLLLDQEVRQKLFDEAKATAVAKLRAQ